MERWAAERIQLAETLLGCRAGERASPKEARLARINGLVKLGDDHGQLSSVGARRGVSNPLGRVAVITAKPTPLAFLVTFQAMQVGGIRRACLAQPVLAVGQSVALADSREDGAGPVAFEAIVDLGEAVMTPGLPTVEVLARPLRHLEPADLGVGVCLPSLLPLGISACPRS